MSDESIQPEFEGASVRVSRRGPYLVSGKFLFVNTDGKEEIQEGNIALCRCGQSKNKPFCDGSHRRTDVLD
jgi:CDGSH-type Zn-finger protein